jgi:ABC-type uncharacterized transport system substrate-binding protein
MIRRREFITLLGGAAIASPLAVRAQQGEGIMRRIGVLMAYEQSDREGRAFVAAFREGLQKLGWMESRNIRIDYRWATPGDSESLQQCAKELVGLQPDLILSNNTPTTLALLEHTQTIPIIFAIVADPLGSRFVTSFARPGGHVTGFTNMEPTMAGKWPELLKEIAPRTTRVARLVIGIASKKVPRLLRPHVKRNRHVLDKFARNDHAFDHLGKFLELWRLQPCIECFGVLVNFK